VRVVRRSAVVAMAAAMCMIAGSPAQAAPNDSGVVDASKRVAGFTAGQLLGEEWRQLLELPPNANPLAGTGDNCLSAGHEDKVLIVWTTAAPTPPTVCNVKPGTAVFFFALSGECSSVEPPPFFGATEEEQRDCAIEWFANPFNREINLSLDGGPVVDIHQDPFRLVSPQGTTVFPEAPIFDATPGRATFVGSGWAATVRHSLRPGRHVINGEVVLNGAPTVRFSLVVKVVKGRGGHS